MAIPLLLLNPYVDAILVIALAVCIGGILNSLTPYIAKIPWVGGSIANAVSGMAQAITHACGVILSPISHAVGGTFHATARLADWTYSEFRRHASLLLQVALTVGGIAYVVQGLRLVVRRLSHERTHDGARIKRLEKEYHGIEHQVKQLEREFRGIDEVGIRKRLGRLTREIDTVRDQTIPALRERVAADEGAFAGLQKWLGINARIDYKSWAIGLTTALLASVGLGGLRCNSLRNNLDRRGCSMWGAMDDLLGLVALGIAAGEFEELVKEAQALTGAATTVFDDVFGLSR